MTTEPEFEVSDRGFKRLKPLAAWRKGGDVRIYESSNAERACLWLKVREPADLNKWPRLPDDPHNEVMVQLTLARAKQLRDQLDWMIRNHYQET